MPEWWPLIFGWPFVGVAIHAVYWPGRFPRLGSRGAIGEWTSARRNGTISVS